MERLFTPWRYEYITKSPSGPAGSEETGCFFCAAAASNDDRAHLTVAHDPAAVIMLNKYPYGHGHLLVAPVRRKAPAVVRKSGDWVVPAT